MGQSFGWDRKNRGPVSQQVCQEKKSPDPSLLKGHTRRPEAYSLQPFTHNGDVSIEMFQSEDKPTNQIYIYIYEFLFIYLVYLV